MPPTIASVRVHLPAALHSITEGASCVVVAADTVGDAIDQLEQRYPGIRARLLDDGEIRRFVSICVDNEDVRFLGGLRKRLKDGDEVSIFPALAGG